MRKNLASAFAFLVLVSTILVLLPKIQAQEPSFGKTNIGSSIEGLGPNQMSGSKFTLNERGTVTKISVYIGSFCYGSGKSKCAIYDCDAGAKPKNKKLESAELSSLAKNSWNNFTVSPGVELAAGDYWILFWSQQNPELRYDTGGSNVGLHSFRTYGVWPDPWTADTTTYCNHLHSMYATYYIIVLSVDVNPKSASLQVGQSQTFISTTSGGTPPYTINWIDNVTKQVIGTGMNYTFYAAAEGSYQIYAQATDSLGATASSVVIPITVYAPPVASFTYTPSTPSVGETVTFDASTSDDSDGTIISYSWDFGDGTTDAGVTVTHAYSSPGTYAVTLIVTDNDGLTDTTTAQVKIYAPPVADFTYSPAKPLVDEPVTFNASASSDDGFIVSYDWDFGDGNVTTVTTPIITHVYAAYGTYTVTLTVTDNDTLTDTTTVPLKVHALPTASFTYLPSSPLVGEEATFDASGSSDPDGYIVSYNWDFGDGNSGIGKITSHTYTAAGTYTVRLNVTDDDSFTNSTTKQITVYAPPVADFVYSPSEPVVGKLVTFNSTSYDPDGVIVSWEWDFENDGLIDALTEDATWTYPVSGTFTVNLTVTDNDGLTDSTTTQITVSTLPVASFTHSPATPLVGELVSFDASASDDPDGTIVSYNWDFGDGTTDTGMVVTHTYSAFGTYIVTLTVTDNDGLTDSTTAQITVHALPIANFTYSPAPPLAGKNVTFDASVSYDSDGTIVSYTWNFGDSNVTTVTTPIITHIYTTHGTYTVNLTVTDNDGLKDSVVHLVEVHTPPVASFTYSPSEPLVGELVTFNSTSSDGDGVILSWEWDLDGDGIVDAATENATWTYTTEGTCTVTLTVTDNDGLTDSTTAQITVHTPSPLTASISPSSPQVVQVGGTVAFAVAVDGGVLPYTQQWYVNGTPVAGETGTAFDFSSGVEGTFIVFARATDSVGTTADSNVTTVTVAAPPQKFKSEIRALFVHAMSLYHPDWEAIAETAQSYGINTIVVEILTSIGARYPSEYVPAWTRDELTPAIAAAHARGISLYISYDVLTMALTDEYKVQDHNGALLNWTCPTKAISRTLIRNLIEEVSSYDIDGIMLDYIRYDSGDMCYCSECRAAFERYLGETITNWPGDFAPGGARYDEFMEWRTYQINYLVRDIRSWALAVNPDLEISAAVWGWDPMNPTYNRYWIGQDSAFWVKEGWLDWITPIIFTTNTSRIAAMMQGYQKYMVAGPEGKIPLVPSVTNAWPDTVDPNNFKLQIDTLRANGADGWIIWRYGGPGDGQGSEAPDIRTYLDLIDLYPTFSLGNINISVVGDKHVVTWTTDLPTTSMVEYGSSPLFTATLEVHPLTGHNYWEPAHVPGTIIQNSTLRTEHRFEIPIPAGTPFYLRVQSSDGQAVATSLVFGIGITGQGILTVDTAPFAGDIYIDGQLMGSGHWSGSVYVGTHIVSYGVVAGYVSPRAQVVDVFENQTTTVTGTYVSDSAISMFVSSSPALVGYEVNIVGSLIYQHNSSGIQNVPVQLYRSIMGAGDSIIASTTTNADGSFSMTWFSLASGDYIIKAVYAGDSDVYGTETAVNLIIRDIEERVFSVSSNSTVSGLTFNSTSRVITFTVSGPTSTRGYVNIFLSKDLVPDMTNLKIYLDGVETDFEAVSMNDVWFIHLSYHHSTHTIRISLATALPTYTPQPLATQVMVSVVVGLLVVLTIALSIRRKKRENTSPISPITWIRRAASFSSYSSKQFNSRRHILGIFLPVNLCGNPAPHQRNHQI